MPKSSEPTRESIVALRGEYLGRAARLKRYERPFMRHSCRSLIVREWQELAGCCCLSLPDHAGIRAVRMSAFLPNSCHSRCP